MSLNLLYLCMCISVLSVCVFCVLASFAALFSPQPCLSTVATFCKVWSQSFTRRLSTTSRAPIGVKWQLEAIHNNTYILYTIDWQTRFTVFCPTGSFIWHMTTIIRSRKANEQNKQESQYSNWSLTMVLSLSQLWTKETLQHGDNGTYIYIYIYIYIYT